MYCPSRGKITRIAVLGRLANEEVTGDFGSAMYTKYIVTALQGISKALPGAEVVFNKGEDIEHAKKLAREADAVVFVVGYDHGDEGEYISEDEIDSYTGAIGGDRKDSLGLHKDEIELIKAVGPENKNSAAVLIGGNMIMMTDWKDYVNAILMAYYPGMETRHCHSKDHIRDVNQAANCPLWYLTGKPIYPETGIPPEQFYEYYQWRKNWKKRE